MIRKVTAIFMSLLLIWAGVPLGAATAAVNPPQQVNVETFGEKVTVDGKQKSLTVWPSLVKGKVYVPLRVFVSALGGTASYDSRKQTVKATLGKTTVSVAGTSGSATVGGKKVSIKPVPFFHYKELYVPAEAFAAWFGYEFVQQGANGQFNKAYYYPDGGSYYVGPLVGGFPEGKGKILFKNGDEYEGDVRKGRENGIGRLSMKSGNTYTGAFKDGEFDGLGVYITKSNDRYAGQFAKGMFHGLIAKNDSLEKGEIELGHHVNNQRHGKGVYVVDGQAYETVYEKSKLVTYKATDRLKAVKFKDGSLAVFEQNPAGEPNGQAYFIGPDGAMFTGTVQTSEGHTVLTGTTSYVNGTQFTGVYVDGRPHGLGMASGKTSKSGLLLDFQGGRLTKAYSVQSQQAKLAPGKLVAIEPRNADPVVPRNADPVVPRDADPILPREADPVVPREADPVLPREADPVLPRFADPIEPRVADSVIPRYAAPVIPFYSAPVEPFFSNIIEQFHAPDVQQRKAEIIKEYRASELSGRTADTLRSDYNGNRSSFEPPQVYASSGPTPTAAQMNAYSAMTALSLSVFSDGALSYSYSF